MIKPLAVAERAQCQLPDLGGGQHGEAFHRRLQLGQHLAPNLRGLDGVGILGPGQIEAPGFKNFGEGTAHIGGKFAGAQGGAQPGNSGERRRQRGPGGIVGLRFPQVAGGGQCRRQMIGMQIIERGQQPRR